MEKKIKLTKSAIDKLPVPAIGKRVEYWDSELKNFGIRISSTSKKFFVMRRVKGALTRVTIGTYGVLTPDQARKLAIETLASLEKGIDLNEIKRKERQKGMTLAKSLERYFEDKPNLKPRTVKTYGDLFRLYLSDWLEKPIAEISKDAVVKRHSQISQDKGKAAADNAMRTLRAIYNYADEIHNNELPPNPVKRLQVLKSWNKVPRRKTVLSSRQLPAVFRAIQSIGNPTIRDYLLLLLLTGARREEMASLTWADVDMREKTFTFTDTKNGKKHTLPMSDYIHEIFKNRQALKEYGNDSVFPGNGKTGRLINPVKQVAAITRNTGIKFCLHDFRRTFATESSHITYDYELKRLLNHASPSNDVTAGYVHYQIDELFAIMQRVTDHLLNLCGYRKADPDNNENP
ncbi:tyrosine-type recombinase/integrase [Syntrophus buswellii]|jgi:integrase|uniref:tyrosine-type recombinase/integrase n=1 Tax=Syntrophus buswellii TaxID=43774 RepID=UPI0038D3E7BA